MAPISLKLIALVALTILFFFGQSTEARPYADGTISGTLLSNFVGGPYPATYSNNVVYNPYAGAGFGYFG